jgi:TolA-binding protein
MSQKEAEIELGVLRDGYPALADWIARDPDNETFVFRKFDKLASRNILHLQAQLTALEREIEQLDIQARQSPESDVRQSLRRYETLINRATDAANPGSLESQLISKLKELKELIKDYRELM